MRVISNTRPTTDVESTDRLFDKLPWITEGTARSKQTAAEQSAAATDRIATASVAPVA
jgi:hypothetical protein